MEYFKTMVDTNMHLDRIYQVALDRVRLSVKSRRLLGENYVPVGFIKTLYNNFFRCRIRRLAPLKDCCDTDLLGRLNPGLRVLKWSACVRALAKLLLLLLLILPWVLRVWVFFAFEDATVTEKLEAADQLGLNTYFKGSLTLYLTPLHAFFVVIYVIIVVDSVVYGVLSKTMKEKFKMVLRKCLRDMRERSRVAVCAWGTRLLVVPFTMFGLVGVLLFPLYLVLVLPFALPVVAFYLFPALNLSVRLIIHFFLFMCPAKVSLVVVVAVVVVLVVLVECYNFPALNLSVRLIIHFFLFIRPAKSCCCICSCCCCCCYCCCCGGGGGGGGGAG